MTLALVAPPRSAPAVDFSPRLAPRRPERSDIADLRKAAKLVGRPLYPWQDLAGQYMTARKRGRWLYPELCLVVARQNGKTGLLVPRIVMGLLRGERIMHTAQDRALPRDVFVDVADVMETWYLAELKRKPRLANGTERIEMRNGGLYRIVAPSRNGARGPSNDLVIVDEAREMDDHDFVAAAQPTLTVSKSPQMVYLSNAGTDESVVLNSLRERALLDDTLGYVEWSARPERETWDRDGWAEANPALVGGVNAKAHLAFLERMHRSYTDAGTLELFRTEHLCQWVDSEAPRVLDTVTWERARAVIGQPDRASVGLAADPTGRRVSAAIAWQADEGFVEGYVLADIDGQPVDLDAAAGAIEPLTRQLGVRHIAYDPWTDRDLARYFRTAKPMQQADWEAAGERFTRTVEAGKLRYADQDGRLTIDMGRTVRKTTAHAWIPVRAGSEPTTASLAFIRAVWMATTPQPTPRVY